MAKKSAALQKTDDSSLADKDKTDKPNGTTMIRAERRESFSGPIPHPDILARYADIIPNGADRILRMAEQQESHRQHLEKVVVESGAKRSSLGMFLGFILTLVLGVGGIFLIAMGKQVDGLAVIFTPWAGLAAVFVYAQRSRKQERESKSKTARERSQNK
jgi:uncharacterized membrane protein